MRVYVTCTYIQYLYIYIFVYVYIYITLSIIFLYTRRIADTLGIFTLYFFIYKYVPLFFARRFYLTMKERERRWPVPVRREEGEVTKLRYEGYGRKVFLTDLECKGGTEEAR